MRDLSGVQDMGEARSRQYVPRRHPDTQVECDLLFVKKHVIFHLMCRCTRWHAGRRCPNKEETTLVSALDEV